MSNSVARVMKMTTAMMWIVLHPYSQRVFPVSEVTVARHCSRKACRHRSEKLMMLLRTGKRFWAPCCSRKRHRSCKKAHRNST